MQHLRKSTIVAFIATITPALLCLGCHQDSPSETSPSNYKAISAQWDDCRLGYGLDNTEVQLTTEEENALGSLIFSYPLHETTKEELSKNEAVYGGSIYRVRFSKDNITYLWTFSSNAITQLTIDNDIASEMVYYEGNKDLLSQIEHFNN